MSGGASIEESHSETSLMRTRPGGRRFSLLGLLVTITLVASLLGNLVSGTKLRRAIEERDRLRREVGFLAEGNDAELSAVRTPSDEPLTWRFRFRVPKQGSYRVVCGTFWPADSSTPRWSGAQSLAPGEHTVVLRILSDPRDDRWKLASVLRSGSNTLRLSVGLDERQTRLFRSSTDTLNAGIGSETVHVASGQRLRLLDQRWINGEGALLLYGDRPPPSDIDGVFLELQPDVGPLE